MDDDLKTATGWLDIPSEQGWYWHWDGDTDHAPFIYSVLWSGTANRFFLAWPDSRWCDEVGGKWALVVPPEQQGRV